MVNFATSDLYDYVTAHLEAEVEHVGAVAAVDGALERIANDQLGRNLHSWIGGHDGTEDKSERQDGVLHVAFPETVYRGTFRCLEV